MHSFPADIVVQSLDRSRITARLGWSSRLIARLAMGVSLATLGSAAIAAPIATVDRNGSLVSVEAYAPNIVRVTIATDRAQVDAPPGDGPNAKPDAAGWTHRNDAGADVFASAALSLSVDAKLAPTRNVFSPLTVCGAISQPVICVSIVPSALRIVSDTGGSDGAK